MKRMLFFFFELISFNIDWLYLSRIFLHFSTLIDMITEKAVKKNAIWLIGLDISIFSGSTEHTLS